MSKLKNDYTCGTCGRYSSDNCYCPLHGEKYEQDTCDDDWADDNEPTEEELEAQAVDVAERKTHAKEVEGEDLL